MEKDFDKGKLPHNLDGFYSGKLIKFLPVGSFENFVDLVTKVWVPWQGKNFFKSSQTGNNKVLGINMIQFKTYTGKSVSGKTQVLKLDYDLPQNYKLIRKVVDELVEIGKDSYLGKAFVKNNGKYRLVAYFSLTKKI